MSKDKVMDVPTRNTSLTGAIFNLTKSAVGAGLLTLPNILSEVGLISGSVMILIGAILSSISLHFLGRISANTDLDSYFALGKLAFGNFGELSALIMLALNLFGALIFYSETVGSYLSTSLNYFFNIKEELWYMSPKFFTVGAGIFLIFPLACLKDMSALAKASIIGMACMSYVALLTVADFFVDSVGMKSNDALQLVVFPKFAVLFDKFSTLLFAYMNHFTMVSLVPVMIDPSPARRTTLILASTLASTVIYMSTAIFGYMHFGASTPENILKIPTLTMPYAIAQFLVAVVLILSFPLLADPCRAGLDQLVSVIVRGGAGYKRAALIRHLGFTTFIVASSVLIATTFAKYALKILSIFSGLFGSMLMFVLPGIYFLRLKSKYPVHFVEQILAYVIIVVGLIVAVIGTYFGVTNFKL